jgi:catechol 2,3-dioxygenase-like lactoylglutathione lyase family enzyme
MAVSRMDHFNILTDDLPATLAFYEEHLNLKPGPRPPFNFPGAWLYADGGKGKDPILHVVAGVEGKRLVKGVIDHMAFYGSDLAGTVKKLKAKGIAYDLRRLPEYGTWQLFFFDPNGAKVEIDFDKSEAAPADAVVGTRTATSTY